MDENLFHYHLSNQDYQQLLRESQHARLIARLQSLQRQQEGAYPHWLAVILVRLSLILLAAGGLLDTAGSKLQDELARAGSLPMEPDEPNRQYSYGD